jgi:hypothetical protein
MNIATLEQSLKKLRRSHKNWKGATKLVVQVCFCTCNNWAAGRSRKEKGSRTEFLSFFYRVVGTEEAKKSKRAEESSCARE